MMDWGAALTFYAGISLLPALLIVIAALGLLGDSTLSELADNLGAVIGFLIWLWLSNQAMLLGVELDAGLEREDAALRPD